MERLDWDSKFFGKDVYRVFVSGSADYSLYSKTFPPNSLIYVFSTEEIEEIKSSNYDKKVTFSIKTNTILMDSHKPSILIYDNNNALENELIDLSIVSSGNSRFRKDSLIPKDKVDELYRIWIQNSINEPKFKPIFIAKENNVTTSMISTKIIGNTLVLELVATRPEYQGRGIGTSLVYSIFSYAAINNISNLEVTTQIENLPACEFYKKLGFTFKSLTYIYHIHK